MNMCTSVRKKKKKRVCQILSPQDMWFPHLDTHSQLPAAGSVSAPRLQQRLHFPLLQKKKVVAQGEECVFSLRMALHEKFQTGNNQPRDKGGALITPGCSDQGWTQTLEFGSWDEQAKKQTRCHKGVLFCFCLFPFFLIYLNTFSVGPSICPESITTFTRATPPLPWGNPSCLVVKIGGGGYRQLADSALPG